MSNYPICLTNWGTVAMTLALTLDAILVLIWHYYSFYCPWNCLPNRPLECWYSGLLKFSRALTAAAYPLALIITIMSGLQLNNECNNYTSTLSVIYQEVFKHFLQTFIANLDTCMSKRSWRLKNIWSPILLGIIYLTFNGLYVFIGDTPEPIYDLLNWKGQLGRSSLIALGLSFIGCPVAYLFFYVLAKVRDVIWKRCLEVGDDLEKLMAVRPAQSSFQKIFIN